MDRINLSADKRFSILPDGTLKISKVTLKDSVKYVCSAKNDYGQVFGEVHYTPTNCLMQKGHKCKGASTKILFLFTKIHTQLLQHNLDYSCGYLTSEQFCHLLKSISCFKL